MECPICFNNWNHEYTIPIVLSCGHSICLECSRNLLINFKIGCPSCFRETTFSVERSSSDTDKTYIEKCINSLTKNQTLLSHIASRQNSRVMQNAREFKYGMVCKKHNFLIHSYVTKPYSMLCDQCIEEISNLNLKIIPFPEVQKICIESLKRLKKNIDSLKEEIERDSHIEMKNRKKDLENHFKLIYKKIIEAKGESLKTLSEKIKLFKDENKAYYSKFEETFARIKISEQRLSFLQKLPIEKLVQERSTVYSLLSTSRDQLSQITVPSISVDVKLKLEIKNLLKEFIKNSISIKLKNALKEKWECAKCGHRQLEGAIQCRCKAFRPIESYPNILSNPSACVSTEISELQQRRKTEIDLINGLDTSHENNTWYFINDDWICRWKNFVLNKNMRPSEQIYEIGVLPPGPINNDVLLDADGNPKKKLKPAAHYRAVNKEVWDAYVNIYGGGPPIVRNSLSIYG